MGRGYWEIKGLVTCILKVLTLKQERERDTGVRTDGVPTPRLLISKYSYMMSSISLQEIIVQCSLAYLKNRMKLLTGG